MAMIPYKARTEGLTPSQQRTDLIYSTIRQRICANHYPPDTMIYEEDLAKEFSVSRSPIRRVLSKLEHEGLVAIRHGVGTVVTRVSPADLEEVYDIRMILALTSGPYFMDPLPENEITFFTARREEFLALPAGDVSGFGEVNIRYYMGLTEMVTNSHLREFQRSLFFQTSRMWLLLLPDMPWEETIQAVADEIDEIIRLIRVQDPRGLGFITRNHIYMSRRRLLAVADHGAKHA